MSTPTPEQLAYLEHLREAQRRRGERARTERKHQDEHELADEPVDQDVPASA